MTVTRSKTGSTPRKSVIPGFVETPGRQRRRRNSTVRNSSAIGVDPVVEIDIPAKSDVSLNGYTDNEHIEKPLASRKNADSKSARILHGHAELDDNGNREFGGAKGVTAMMLGFPLLMWYMWIGATYYDGKIPWPAKNQSTEEWARYMFHLGWTGAFPTMKAWTIYWTFFIFEAILYLVMPGVYAKGKPLPQLGVVLHLTGTFKLYTLIDEFGPLMTVAIISGFGVSVMAYASALARGAQHRMSGDHILDFFMGAELNPRMFKWLDFKMFFEIRLPWFILFLVTVGACARQYEQYGYVSGELGFLLMAHWLYANACCKGEELIPITWDMFYEKWGFMLIFWNMAGVPLSYCHCTIYLANHDPALYRWPRWFLVCLYVSYIFVYWVWDTANSQKNMFRARQRGNLQHRRTFPQLPWKEVVNPRTIRTDTGDDLLCDGWYGMARKIHYTCDAYFALTWALVTGFASPFPWFYPVFFVTMIAHRASRDIHRCRQRYGKAWEEYERRVPYLFVPYLF